MTFVAAALLVVPLQYGFEPGFQVKYDSEIQFEGFIPIFGGQEDASVVVSMVVNVEGLQPENGAPLRAASEIIGFKVMFGPAALPFDATDVQDYFPRTTIGLTPDGKIVKSDAPDVSFPVRLPGLDVKRFPDITYVPIQFPTDGATVGQEWSFKKPFGESDMLYSCRLMKVTDGIAKIAVQIEQEYEVLENAALEVVKDEADAERRVKTTIGGAGVVYFDTRAGMVQEVLMVNEATSVATSLIDGEVTERVLMTTFSLKLHVPVPSQGEPAGGGLGRGSNNKSPFHNGSQQTLLEAAWSSAKDAANNALSWAKSAWTLVKLALSSAISSLAGK